MDVRPSPRHLARLAAALVLALVPVTRSAGQDGPPPPTVILDRPAPEAGPTPVSVGIFVIDIPELDDVARTFTVDVAVRASWTDPRLAGGTEVRMLELEEIWHPLLQAINKRRLVPTMPEVVSVDPDGNVLYRQRLYGTLTARFDLHDYPLDEQVLQIRLVSLLYGPSEIALSIDEGVTGRAANLSIADSWIGPASVRVGAYHVASGIPDRASIVYEMPARRHRSYFILKVIVPLCTIIVMSWLAFWIDPERVGPQISLSATSLLTLIAYRFMLGTLVPRIPYMTRLDLFILGATILVFLALVESVLTCNLAIRGHQALAQRIDRLSRWSFPTLFGVLVVVSFVI